MGLLEFIKHLSKGINNLRRNLYEFIPKNTQKFLKIMSFVKSYKTEYLKDQINILDK